MRLPVPIEATFNVPPIPTPPLNTTEPVVGEVDVVVLANVYTDKPLAVIDVPVLAKSVFALLKAPLAKEAALFACV